MNRRKKPPLVVRPGQFRPEVLRFLKLLAGARNVQQVLLPANGELRELFLPDDRKKGA
jgi:hypothetical protein